jgi:hypothetical protein
MKLVEKLYPSEHKLDFKTRYIKYRAGRLKHQYWLWNRKSKDKKLIDSYDAFILKNCQPGQTAFFASSGYYLKEINNDIDVIEMHPIVKEFYPNVIITTSRDQLEDVVPYKFDNFAVVNNRGDHWVGVDGLTDHLKNYCKILNPSGRIFYSFRDTQIHYNRLIVNHYDYFLSWAMSLETIGLTLVWHDIQFAKKEKDPVGNYDGLENPDTTNGNLKFWFVYKGKPWVLIN